VFAISLYIFHLSVSLISLAVASTIDIAYMFGAFDIDGKATQEGMEKVCDAFRSKPTQREKREEEIERERERERSLFGPVTHWWPQAYNRYIRMPSTSRLLRSTPSVFQDWIIGHASRSQMCRLYGVLFLVR
jgi:hypothetical protein